MEKQPDISRKYDGVEVSIEVLPILEEKDVVLSALKKQLKEEVIDPTTYKERRQAYLNTFLPELPDLDY